MTGNCLNHRSQLITSPDNKSRLKKAQITYNGIIPPPPPPPLDTVFTVSHMMCGELMMRGGTWSEFHVDRAGHGG